MSSGCDIDHRVATLLDDFQKWLEQIRILVRTTILGISSMQMDDRRARFSRRDCRICDFLGSNRQMGRHGRCVNGTGHGAAENALTLAHGVNFTSLDTLRAILTCIQVSRPLRLTGHLSRVTKSAERSLPY